MDYNNNLYIFFSYLCQNVYLNKHRYLQNKDKKRNIIWRWKKTSFFYTNYFNHTNIQVSVHKALAPVRLKWSFGLPLPTCHSYPDCSRPASFWTAVSCGSKLRSHIATDTPPLSGSDWRSLRTPSKWMTRSSVSGGCRTIYSLCHYSYLKLRDTTLTRTDMFEKIV